MFCNRNSDVTKFISLLLNGVLQWFNLSLFVRESSLNGVLQEGAWFPNLFKKKNNKRKKKKLRLFQNLKQLTVFMKKPMGLVGDYLNSLILLRTVAT
jgi:hypothetical protein